MNDTHVLTYTHALEVILRGCEAAAPEPWFPRVFAQETGADSAALDNILEDLWLEGLIQSAERVAGRGPGIRLTPLGERVLREEALLERLRKGQPLIPGDPGAEVRHSLRNPPRPWVTRVLLTVNLLFFAYGLLLAARLGGGAIGTFLTAGALGRVAASHSLVEILHQSGSVSGVDLLHGQWWRLMTAAFCHLGFLHLLMNMYMLVAAGSAIEQRWGWWRYLWIYLLGAWGGSCMAMAFSPATTCVGASGALCGVLAAEAVWVVLTGRYLPRALARRGRMQIFSTLVLLAIISVLPGVSGWGHLGGGVGGLLAALVLHFQRFGPRLLRPLAWPVLLSLPLLGWGLLEQARTTPRWQRLERPKAARESKVVPESADERDQFDQDFVNPIRRTAGAAEKCWDRDVKSLVSMHPRRRDAARVETALAALAEKLEALRALTDRLARTGPYKDADVEKARITGRDYLSALAEQLALGESCLQAGEKWKTRQDEELRKQLAETERRREAWKELVEKRE
jgi:membrane associated rhomboid family serine protease